MKKVGNHNSILKTLFVSLALMATFTAAINAQEAPADAAATVPAADAPAATTEAAAGDPVKGKALFNSNCAACHKLDGKATGPALRGVASRRDTQWLYKWIHNSSDMIKSGDPIAVQLFNENNKSVMTAFPQLSNGDIDNILAYTSEEKKAPAPNPTAGPPGTAGADIGISNTLILGAL